MDWGEVQSTVLTAETGQKISRHCHRYTKKAAKLRREWLFKINETNARLKRNHRIQNWGWIKLGFRMLQNESYYIHAVDITWIKHSYIPRLHVLWQN